MDKGVTYISIIGCLCLFIYVCLQRDKELLHKKIIELEVKLDQKQALELQIECLRGAVEVMKHMTEGSENDEKKLESIEEELQEKEDELEGLESLNQALIVKERKTNDELQEARKELISVSFSVVFIADHRLYPFSFLHFLLNGNYVFLKFCKF